MLKQAHIPYSLHCHMQIDVDPDPTYHFDADTDPAYHSDADPDPTFQFDANPCGSGSRTQIFFQIKVSWQVVKVKCFGLTPSPLTFF